MNAMNVVLNPKTARAVVSACAALLLARTTLALDAAQCGAAAKECATQCIGAIFSGGVGACKDRCLAESKVCTQSAAPGSNASGANAPADPAATAKGAQGQSRATKVPRADSVEPQRLGVGLLAVGPMVTKQSNVRELLTPMLDGVPAFLAARDSRLVHRFTVSFREQIVGLQNGEVPVTGLQNDSEGRALDHYFRVRTSLSRPIVGPEVHARPEANIVQALDAAFVEQHTSCVDPNTGSQGMTSNCFGGNARLWKGETEFDTARTKEAFIAGARKALFAAYGQRSVKFLLLEQRALRDYNASAGGFVFEQNMNASALQTTANPEAPEGPQNVSFISLGMRFPKSIPTVLRMPIDKAEAWSRTLQEQNKAEGLKRRTVFTLTRVSCQLGEPGALPHPTPCNVDAFEVYSDGEFKKRAPL